MENNIITNAQTNAQAKKTESKPPKTIRGYVASMMPEIKKALPSVITPERFTRMVLSAIGTTPALAQCTPNSFLGAMMTAAQLGVEPNTPLGQAYLIPYKNKGTIECQFQLGYKGLIDLAYRSGQISVIQAHTVYENDEFNYELGLHPKLEHKPARDNRGNPIYYYAVFETKDGGYGFEVASIEDITAFASKYSKSFGTSFSPWSTSFDEMAKKTVLKRCLKYAPLKSDFIRATLQDETIKTDLAEDMTEVQDNTIYANVDEGTGEVVNNANTNTETD